MNIRGGGVGGGGVGGGGVGVGGVGGGGVGVGGGFNGETDREQLFSLMVLMARLGGCGGVHFLLLIIRSRDRSIRVDTYCTYIFYCNNYSSTYGCKQKQKQNLAN